METYPNLQITPDKKYISFLLNLLSCPVCNRGMVKKPKDHYDTFPYYVGLNFDAQVRSAGLVIRSNVMIDGEYICNDCARNGSADFLCRLCEERKKSHKIKDSFGDPPSYLCIDCFNTVTAAEWDKIYNQLSEEHRYDYY